MSEKQSLKIILFIVLFFAFSSCGKKDESIIYEKKYIAEIKAARKEATFFMASNQIPGGSFAISKSGKIIYSEGLGFASTDLEVPAKRETKYRIADVSEVFTSLIYHLMVEDGILHPDSVVTTYLPEFPKKKFDVTLDNLVNHTSGIREPLYNETDWRGLNVSLQKGLETFENDSLVLPPDTEQFNSFYNYNLLGAIMEKAKNQPFHKIVKEYLTDSLHLENTVLDNPFITIKNRSDFYDYNIVAQVANATTRDLRYKAPSQGLLSTPEDMVKLGNTILYSDDISNGIRKKLFKPVVLKSNAPAGLTNGWILIENQQGRKMYGRIGSVTGGSAVLLIIPDYEIVFACAFNLNVNPDQIPVFKILSPFLKEVKSTENKSE